MPLSSLDTTRDYQSHPNLIKAKDSCAEAKTACVTADGDVANANRASESATTEAAHEVSECNCRVKKVQATNWENAQVVTHVAAWLWLLAAALAEPVDLG